MTDQLSSDDVRDAVFTRSPLGRRGYEPKSVHDLLKLAARRLDGRGYLDADHVRSATFRTAPLLQRGYDKAEVDAFVARVAVAIEALDV